MSKARATKEKILRQAAELFNQQGYSGASISDIMHATGLQKGGIYNHFQSKDELALQAFDYAYSLLQSTLRTAIKGKRRCRERLQAMLSIHLSLLENPPIPGGCPILNTAIESDDTHPALRDRAQQAMDAWRSLIMRIITQGIAKGEVSSTVEADVVATVIISTLEGGLMMSKLYADPIHLQRAVDHLNLYLENHLKVKS